jgi:hypothetical protein
MRPPFPFTRRQFEHCFANSCSPFATLPAGIVSDGGAVVSENLSDVSGVDGNEAADENPVATFAYRIMLNVRGLQGNQDDK